MLLYTRSDVGQQMAYTAVGTLSVILSCDHAHQPEVMSIRIYYSITHSMRINIYQ